jgi:hypothetical protein
MSRPQFPEIGDFFLRNGENPRQVLRMLQQGCPVDVNWALFPRSNGRQEVRGTTIAIGGGSS